MARGDHPEQRYTAGLDIGQSNASPAGLFLHQITLVDQAVNVAMRQRSRLAECAGDFAERRALLILVVVALEIFEYTFFIFLKHMSCLYVHQTFTGR